MPTISWLGIHERTHVFIPIWASIIWFFGPVGGTWASNGRVLLMRPHPISAGAVPSSLRPSMLHVPTNSSTSFGLSDIWVSLWSSG